MGKRSLPEPRPLGGWVGSQLSACVASLKYPRTTCYVFSPKGQKRSSPFKIRIPLLFVSFWNTVRADWGHNSELSTLPTLLPQHLSLARKKKSEPRDWWIVKIIVELGYKALGKQMIAWDHGPVNQCHRTPLTLFFGHQPSGLCSTRDRCYWITALFPQHVEAI